MADRYSEIFSSKVTPQTQPIPGTQQVKNNAGGFGWQIDKWDQLQRFLILGSAGGTYYVTPKKITLENAAVVVECIKEDGPRAVRQIVDVSLKGRAPKQDPGIFALALACTHGDGTTKRYAYSVISSVCRTGTTLFQFCQSVQDLRGWSRGLRSGVAAFYTKNTVENVEYQLLKYKQRDGWTHRDVMRLAHPKAPTVGHNALFRNAVGKPVDVLELPQRTNAVSILHSKVRDADPVVRETPRLIREYRLTREMLPTELLKSKEVWEALLHDMPLGALVRNLGKLAAVGVTTSAFDAGTQTVVNKLTNADLVKKSRLHPVALLNALKVYSNGKGEKGKLTWNPVAAIKQALNDAFYLAFQAIEPTGKRFVFGVDVSGSMDFPNCIPGVAITPREAAAVMMMATARTEPSHETIFFAANPVKGNIPTTAPLEHVVQMMQQLPMGRTDCAVPIMTALNYRWPVDAFVIYTDNETYAGHIHPAQALQMYRRAMGIDAKMIVCGMASTGFTIADPNDAGMLDCVGFDTATPAVIADFVRG